MTFVSIFFCVSNQSTLTSLLFKDPGILPDSLFSEIKKNLLLILISNVQLKKQNLLKLKKFLHHTAVNRMIFSGGSNYCQKVQCKTAYFP